MLQFDVFLSHNSKDRKTVEGIAKQLKERGVNPWLDSWELRPGSVWPLSVQKQLKKVKSVAVFIGSKGIGSWQLQEIEESLSEFIKRGCRIIPVLLPGASIQSDLHLFLRDKTWVDYRSPEHDPINKLVWGIKRIRRKREFTTDLNMNSDSFNEYQVLKQKVVDIYESYRSIVPSRADTKVIDQHINGVKEDKYTIVIVGEVKAGKSTFINALLGEMVAPTGILQSTSAIIEFFRSNERFVRISYGNGKKTTKNFEVTTSNEKEKGEYGSSTSRQYSYEVSQYLKEVASVQEKYRGIPFIDINKKLIEFNGGNISQSEMQALIEESFNYNEYNLSYGEFKSIVTEYVSEFQDLSKIPTKIEMGFPLDPKFASVTLVDTPGVNARGRIQNLTDDYVSGADAFVLLSSIELSTSSEALRKFAERISEQREDVMFSLLTQSGSRDRDFIAEKLKDHQDQYSDVITKPERITHLDSILKIISDESAHFKSIEDLKKTYVSQKKKLKIRFDNGDNSVKEMLNVCTQKIRVLTLLQSEWEEESVDLEGTSLRTLLLERSNFKAVSGILGSFASSALSERLIRILSTISSDYINQKTLYREKTSLLRAKIDDPDEFQQRLASVIEEIQNTKEKLDKASQELRDRYCSRDANWRDDIGDIKREYKDEADELIGKKKPEKKAKKLGRKLAEELDELADEVLSNLFSDALSKIKEYEIEFSVSQYSCDTPGVKVGSVVSSAAQSAEKTREVWEDRTETVIEKEPYMFFFEKDVEVSKTVKVRVEQDYYDDDEFRTQLSKGVKKRLKKVVNEAAEEIEDAISRFCNAFDRQASNFIAQRKGYVNKLETEQQQTLEEYESELKTYDDMLKAIDTQLQIIIPLMPDEELV